MIQITPQMRVLVAVEAVDFRVLPVSMRSLPAVVVGGKTPVAKASA